jgi:NAD(P)-dependent dehydrogenase (short-subunit alcohol dehydrogenase family)
MSGLGVVLGASGGIGSACAVALASSVSRLALVGRDKGRLARVAADVGAVADVIRADIAATEGRAAVLRAVSEGPALRWVVMASGRPLRGPLSTLTEEDIMETFQANLVGPALLLQGLARLEWVRGASVVVIGSISASRAIAERAVYAASKAGLERLAISLAAEWAPRGIRVSVVAPGVIETPFLGSDHARLESWATAHVPSGRTGSPDEIAQVVRYLCLDAPDYLVGARIAVDGGSEAVA